MRLPKILTTPLPSGVLALGEDQITLGLLSRRRDALLRVESAPVGGECFKPGPVGLLHVERGVLASALSALVQRTGKLPSRGSLVVPTSWVRCVQVDTGGLPRQRQEAEDVIRWRIKKLLPCRPEEVRLDFLPVGSDGRVLVTLALDRPLAVVEDTVAAAGMRLGRIEPTVLAISNLAQPAGGARLIVAAEPRSLGFAGIQDGTIVLLRQKSLPADPGRAAEFVTRELDQSLTLLQPAPDAAGSVEVLVVAYDEVQAAGVEAHLLRCGGVAVRRLAVGADRVPAGVDLTAALLGTLLACGAGREE